MIKELLTIENKGVENKTNQTRIIPGDTNTKMPFPQCSVTGRKMHNLNMKRQRVLTDVTELEGEAAWSVKDNWKKKAAGWRLVCSQFQSSDTNTAEQRTYWCAHASVFRLQSGNTAAGVWQNARAEYAAFPVNERAALTPQSVWLFHLLDACGTTTNWTLAFLTGRA